MALGMGTSYWAGEGKAILHQVDGLFVSEALGEERKAGTVPMGST